MAVIRAYVSGLRRWVRGMDVWERVRYMAVDMNVILLYHAGARRFLRAYSVSIGLFFCIIGGAGLGNGVLFFQSLQMVLVGGFLL